MLKIWQYEKRSQLKELFSQYNPQQQTWLVSDLRTKFELQQQLLSERGHYVDEAILRASDLWRLLLRRAEPQMREVSESFVRSLLKAFLNQHADVLGVGASSEESVFAYMNLLSSIHLHPEGEARLSEWFEEHPDSAQRWQEWYLRSRLAMKVMTQQHRLVSSKWIPAYLQKFSNLEKFWQQTLIVDLGSEISRVEGELLRALSRHVDVIILEPVPEWKKDFQYLLRPYEDLRAQSQEIKKLPAVASPALNIQVLRFSGMLAEVKEAVSRVRLWLEEGRTPESISVIAPEIEAYWPVLQSFLEKEGLPFQKEITGKLQGLPGMVRWLATLRSKSGQFSVTDLEISFFDSENAQNMRYEEFKSLFKTLYGSEDFSRNAWIQKAYHQQINVDQFLRRDEFVTACMREWPEDDTEAVQTVLRELLKNAVESTSLLWKDWLSYLENIVASKEYSIAKASRNGIMVTKLMSAHSAQSQSRIFLGLSEEGLKKKLKVKLMSDDYSRLAQDLGFYLENPDQSDLEFELKLLRDSGQREDLFFFGSCDFAGALLSPSSFWIEMKSAVNEMKELEKLQEPGATRWDEIQESALPVRERIQQDLGLKEIPALQLNKWPRLSASAIESYLKCPFIFAAQRYFRLLDLPDIDLDVDHRTRGQLAHALFERLTVEPVRYDWREEELNEILETARVEKNLAFADERLWLPFRRKHVHMARRFLEKEKVWRAEFPQTKTIGREARFEFYLNFETGEISRGLDPSVPAQKVFKFSGQIDRIDQNDQGQLALIDYKSSAASAYSVGTWISDHHIQLLMYMWAIEQEMVQDVKGEVLGVFYYIIKNFARKGFQLDEQAGSLFPAFKRKTKGHDQVTKEKYLEEFFALLMSSLKKIAAGEIQPKPSHLDDCKTCEWRRLCRAPHLM